MYGVYMCVCYYWTAATARVIIIIWFRTRVLRDVYILGMPRVDTVCRYSNIYNIQSENSSTRDGLGYEILYSAARARVPSPPRVGDLDFSIVS